MNRKNKIMAALAMGAVALVVASGVARCALSEAGDPPPEPAPAQEAEHAEPGTPDEIGRAHV